MASDALHLLFIDPLSRDARLQADLRALLDAERKWLRLGAVMIDLPYFDGFLSRALDDLRGRPDRTSYWGDRFHRDGAQHLVGALLRRAVRAEQPGPLVALAIGLHSHVLLDVATHGIVNRAAQEIVERGGGRPEAAHRAVENAQAELWHQARFGRRLFGDPRSFPLLAVRGDLLGRGLLGTAIVDACEETFGWAPGRLDWHRWGLGLLEYAFTLAGPAGRLHVPGSLLETHRRWFDGRSCDFEALVESTRDQLATDAAELFAHYRTGRLAPAVLDGRFPERNLDFPDQPPSAGLAL